MALLYSAVLCGNSFEMPECPGQQVDANEPLLGVATHSGHRVLYSLHTAAADSTATHHFLPVILDRRDS
jgi:hypothetical protein